MSRIVTAALAFLVVGGVAAAAWFAVGGSEPAPEPADPGRGLPSGTVPSGRGSDPPAPPPRPDRPRPPSPPKQFKPWDPGPPLVEPEGEPVLGAGLTFPYPQWPEVAQVDWTRVGHLMRKAQRNLRRCAVRMLEGQPGDRLRGEIDSAFGDVMNGAVKLIGPVMMSDVDPINVFGSICGLPAFESNALAATLAAWGRPLSEQQVKDVGALYREHARVWLENRGSPPEEWPIPAVAAIAKSRAALQVRLEEILDEPQRDALWPPEVKGRIALDLFSATSLLRDRISLIEGADSSAISEEFSRRLLAYCDLGFMAPEKIAPAFDEWYANMPEEWRAGVRGTFAHAGYLTYEEVLPSLEELPRLLAKLETAGTRRDPRFHRLRRIMVPAVAR